ncbi:Protein of unknown function, partial [Gryllus bimaculatus]
MNAAEEAANSSAAKAKAHRRPQTAVAVQAGGACAGSGCTLLLTRWRSSSLLMGDALAASRRVVRFCSEEGARSAPRMAGLLLPGGRAFCPQEGGPSAPRR